MLIFHTECRQDMIVTNFCNPNGIKTSTIHYKNIQPLVGKQEPKLSSIRDDTVVRRASVICGGFLRMAGVARILGILSVVFVSLYMEDSVREMLP